MRHYLVTLEDDRRVAVEAADDIDLVRELAKDTAPWFPKIKTVIRENPREGISQASLEWLKWLWDRMHFDAQYERL